jgi:hypothetical protein
MSKFALLWRLATRGSGKRRKKRNKTRQTRSTPPVARKSRPRLRFDSKLDQLKNYRDKRRDRIVRENWKAWTDKIARDTVRRTMGLKQYKPYDRRKKIKSAVKALQHRQMFADTTTGNRAPAVGKEKVCENRHVRREVMHALGKSGKGGQKKPVWTEKSKIKCKEKK